MFKKPVLTSFSVTLAILGGGISMISSFVNETSSMFLVSAAFISAIIMGLMGIGIYYLLEWQIPVLFANDQNETEENSNEDVNKLSTQDAEISLEEEFSEQEDKNKDSDTEKYGQEEDILNPGVNPMGTSIKDAGNISYSGADNVNQNKDDKIVVENIMLKNDPKLMTETVKHVLDSEEDQ